MNIKNYYTKAAMLVVSLGFITALQSCTKDKNILPGSTEDKNLIGAWKRTIHRVAQGDSVQTLTFYEGTLTSSLLIDVYSTPASSANSTLYKGVFDTDGTALYVKLNQKQNSATDLNGSGTPVSEVLFDTTPYKIDSSTLSITAGSTVIKFTKVQ